MNIFCLSKEEIQRFRLAYSVSELSNIFDLEKTELYQILVDLEILSPVDYLRSMSRYQLACEISCSSHELVARRYLVSVSFLRSLFAESKPDLSRFDLQALSDKFGSRRLVSRLYNVNERLVPAPKSKDALYLSFGAHRISYGRKAELFALSMIQGVDQNIENSSHRYDIHHPVYGRVNVKSRRSPTIRLKEISGCDHIAFVPRNSSEDPIGLYLIPAVLQPITFCCRSPHPSAIIIKEYEGLIL